LAGKTAATSYIWASKTASFGAQQAQKGWSVSEKAA